MRIRFLDDAHLMESMSSGVRASQWLTEEEIADVEGGRMRFDQALDLAIIRKRATRVAAGTIIGFFGAAIVLGVLIAISLATAGSP